VEAEVAAALWQVEAAFVAHQAREVLESLTPRQGPVVLAEIDPLALVLGLGETIGAPDDVRALTPWLLRAVAGAPERVQIMYGLRGERRIPEYTLPWLSGYEHSIPVRIGNAAVDQFQLDVFGEVIDVMYQSHVAGMPPDDDEWSMMTAVIEAVCARWREPDRGLWEVRGPARHFTHPKVLALSPLHI